MFMYLLLYFRATQFSIKLKEPVNFRVVYCFILKMIYHGFLVKKIR